MASITKSKDKPNNERPKRLSKKELTQQFRHEAYLRAKEFRKTDPRQIAMKEKFKEQRRDVYQQAKERNKAYRDELKKANKKHSTKKKTAKQNKLRAMLVPASTIKGQETENRSRMAKVTRQHIELVKAKKATVADIARLAGIEAGSISNAEKIRRGEKDKRTGRKYSLGKLGI